MESGVDAPEDGSDTVWELCLIDSLSSTLLNGSGPFDPRRVTPSGLSSL